MDFSVVFSDVVPIPQDDGPEPVCSIAYSAEFIEAHDILRALLKADERSERALNLTSICLKLNPANYTVWHYRRRCLIALSTSDESRNSQQTPTIDTERIEMDLEFADKLGGTNPKNYQLWYHRRALLEFQFDKNGKEGDNDELVLLLDVANKELSYVDKILNDDSKNYHAWSHRQWIIKTVNHSQLWINEIEYSHTQIISDVRNNSAWNQRWFAVHEGKNTIAMMNNHQQQILSFDKAKEEASYALSGANVDIYNESPWRYLIGILMEQWRYANSGGGGDATTITMVTCLIEENIGKIRDMKKSYEDQPPPTTDDDDDHHRPTCPSVCLIAALVDLLELCTYNKALLKEAKALVGILIVEDPIRRKYWRMREMYTSKLLRSVSSVHEQKKIGF